MTFPLCCGYLGHALPSIGRPPWLKVFFTHWYGFFPSLALLYDSFSIGGCKGPYALTGSLPVYTCGTQHWGATQYTHNHTCNRTVYVLHSRVVTFGGKHVGIWMLNKRTFTWVICLTTIEGLSNSLTCSNIHQTFALRPFLNLLAFYLLLNTSTVMM